jgi:hypothetical protein
MKGGIKMAKDKKKKETDEKREDEVGEVRPKKARIHGDPICELD